MQCAWEHAIQCDPDQERFTPTYQTERKMIKKTGAMPLLSADTVRAPRRQTATSAHPAPLLRPARLAPPFSAERGCAAQTYPYGLRCRAHSAETSPWRRREE